MDAGLPRGLSLTTAGVVRGIPEELGEWTFTVGVSSAGGSVTRVLSLLVTDLKVELALASATSIRQLIRQVYARAPAAEEEQQAPTMLRDALDSIMGVEAPRFGISVRGVRAHAWWDEGGKIRRVQIAGDWRSELERVLLPGPSEMTAGTARSRWEAEFNRGGVVTPIDVHFIADESGREYLFKSRRVEKSLEERFSLPAEGVVSEVRLLARSGTARFVVLTDPPELGHDILPHLPTLLLDPAWRSIYVNARDQGAADEAFSLRMPDDPATWAAELEALQAFHFDVVTVDLSGGDKVWAGSALDIASVAFLLWQPEDDLRPAFEAGIRWLLRIEKQAGGGLDWTLEPLNA